MAEAVTLKLKNPIEFGSQRVEELTIRPCKAKDLRRLQASPERPLAMTFELAGYLTGQVAEVIDELEGEDMQEVLRVVSGFLDDGQKTGGVLSPS